MIKKKKWIAISESTYQLLKDRGKFLGTFDDIISELLEKQVVRKQSLGIGEP